MIQTAVICIFARRNNPAHWNAQLSHLTARFHDRLNRCTNLERTMTNKIPREMIVMFSFHVVRMLFLGRFENFKLKSVNVYVNQLSVFFVLEEIIF